METATTHNDAGQVFRDWRFTGYSRENTDHGRVYVATEFSAGDVTVRIYRDELRSNLVASGTLVGATSGEVALAEVASSGLSGAVTLRNATGAEVVRVDVFYCCDDDLLAYKRDLQEFLDDAGEFNGGHGFNTVCDAAKRELDELLQTRRLYNIEFDSLQPLTPSAIWYALSHLFRTIDDGRGGPSWTLHREMHQRGRRSLSRIRLHREGAIVTPFSNRIQRG